MTALHNPAFFADQFLGQYPLEYQEEILLAKERFLVIRCGRQIGKTWTVCVKGIHYAFTHKDRRVLIIAPSQRQSSRVFRIIKNYIMRSEILRRSIDYTQPQTQTEINLTNGVSIICLPAVADTIRGEHGDLIIIDEASFVQDDVFNEVIMPMIAATRGSMWLISTPKGKRGFFYRGSMRANKGKPGWKEFYYPSSVATRYIRKDTGRPQIDPEFLIDQKESIPDVIYRQEYEAEFVESSDNYLSSEQIDRCVQPVVQLTSALPGREYYLGADFAKKQDKFVVMVMEKREDINSGEIVKVIAREGIDYHDQVYIIGDLMGRFDIRKGWIDRTGVGEMPYEALKQMDYSYNIEGTIMSLQKKQTIYANLKRHIETTNVIIPPDEKMIEELKALRYEYTLSGMNIKIFGEKYDDYCDALALVSQCLSRPTINANIHGSDENVTHLTPLNIVNRRGINIKTGTKGILDNLKRMGR